jgi:hypothetical protein
MNPEPGPKYLSTAIDATDPTANLAATMEPAFAALADAREI